MIVGLLILAAAAIDPAPAQESFGQVGDWLIFYDRTGCGAQRDYPGGLRFGISYDDTANDSIVLLSSPTWRSVQPREIYSVTVRFSDGSDYNNVDAAGLVNEPSLTPAIGLRVNSIQFLTDLSISNDLFVLRGDRIVTTIHLDHSRQMVDMLSHCAAAALLRANRGDPFQGAPHRPAQ